MVTTKILLIDFISTPCYYDVLTSKGASYEHGQNYFFSSDGIPASLRIPQMRPALSRRLQGAKFFVPGSIFMHGLRATDISRKFTRHRILPAIHADETLSHGFSRFNIKKHISRCQQSARLAYLCRPRPGLDSSRQEIISQRTFRRRIETGGLRAGCHNDRFMLISIPLGAFSPEQSRRQIAHTSRPARQYPDIYPNHRRKSSRCQHPGHSHSGSRIILHYGQRLSGFCSSLHAASKEDILHRAHQIKYSIQKALFPSYRQVNRPALRSNNSLNRLSISQSLYTILQILSVTIFDKTYILQALTETKLIDKDDRNDNQLELFKL